MALLNDLTVPRHFQSQSRHFATSAKSTTRPLHSPYTAFFSKFELVSERKKNELLKKVITQLNSLTQLWGDDFNEEFRFLCEMEIILFLA